MDLTELTLYETADLIARREITPVELTQAYLTRIEQVEPKLNSFITLTAEAALQSARQAEETLRRGGYHGLLHGIPIALKDLFETQGVRTTAGSKIFADLVPETDGAVIKKLKAAGAVILGKLNMH